MISTTTICAIATAPGRGGIAIIRLSGQEAWAIAEQFLMRHGQVLHLAPQHARRALYADFTYEGKVIDEVIVLPFVAPYSFTGEDVVEIHCHGSAYITRTILEALTSRGAVMARPGEFSQRAYLNGRIDLTQAEAVADIIASETEAQHRMAMSQMRGGFSNELRRLRDELLRFTALMELELDFPEEDVEFTDRSELRALSIEIESKVRRLIESYRLGNAIKNGTAVALIGATNVGKSTLMNTLMGEERAIVSDIHGTTRDTIEDTLTLGGYLFRFIDTAGLRQTTDQIEELGIERSRYKMKTADIVLLLIDPLRLESKEQGAVLDEVTQAELSSNIIVLINKSDLITPELLHKTQETLIGRGFGTEQIIAITAREHQSVDTLRERLISLIDQGQAQQTDILVNNARHHQLLTDVATALRRLDDGFDAGIPTDLLTLELRTAIHAIGEITGQQITSQDALHYIFAHFCIGK